MTFDEALIKLIKEEHPEDTWWWDAGHPDVDVKAVENYDFMKKLWQLAQEKKNA